MGTLSSHGKIPLNDYMAWDYVEDSGYNMGLELYLYWYDDDHEFIESSKPGLEDYEVYHADGGGYGGQFAIGRSTLHDAGARGSGLQVAGGGGSGL
ncbi:hypothetical protein CRG98_010216 [Punica granatum]|uniref:Uncharacterized protein n=1 Tax=Punica granatum TaxID=22663 RepID=A0A2I0KLP1_PUNGR|nr:hypothetical protein CRG98_010216 [Punica granatum]